MSDVRVLVGFHAVTSRLRLRSGSIREIYLDSKRRDGRARELMSRAAAAGVRIIESDGARLHGLAGTSKHQGVVALADALALGASVDEVLTRVEGPALFLVLDGVQDPHNLGACLRVADAFGAHAVIAPKDRAVGLTAAVSKVASGAAEAIPYLQVTNLARSLRELRDAGVWVLGADQEGTQSISQARLDGSLAWVLGAEGQGLRRLTRESCDEVLAIPMQGTVESLNLSVAAGICLYESRRNHSLKQA